MDNDSSSEIKSEPKASNDDSEASDKESDRVSLESVQVLEINNVEEEQRKKKQAYNRRYKASLTKEQRALYKANERHRAKIKLLGDDSEQYDLLPLQRRKRPRILTEEQRRRKIASDHIYRASLTDEQREKIRARYRERAKTLTKDQRERRLAAQRKYRANMTEEQRLRRKIRERERLKFKDNIPARNSDVTVEPFKRWTMLSIEQREKRDACPRTYGSTMSKEERELKRSKFLGSSKLSSTDAIKSEPCEKFTPSNDLVIKSDPCDNLSPSNDVVNKSDLNDTIKTEVKKESDLFESHFEWISWVKKEKADVEQ